MKRWILEALRYRLALYSRATRDLLYVVVVVGFIIGPPIWLVDRGLPKAWGCFYVLFASFLYSALYDDQEERER